MPVLIQDIKIKETFPPLPPPSFFFRCYCLVFQFLFVLFSLIADEGERKDTLNKKHNKTIKLRKSELTKKIDKRIERTVNTSTQKEYSFLSSSTIFSHYHYSQCHSIFIVQEIVNCSLLVVTQSIKSFVEVPNRIKVERSASTRHIKVLRKHKAK